MCNGNEKNFILELAMQTQRGKEVQLYSFFNLGDRLGWMVKATPRLLYPRERVPAPIV